MFYLILFSCVVFFSGSVTANEQTTLTSPTFLTDSNDSNESKHIYLSRGIPGGYHVKLTTKTLSQKENTFPVTKELKRQLDDIGEKCPDTGCVCQEDVSYFELTGTEAGIAQINELEQKAAQNSLCKPGYSIMQNMTRSANITYPYVSFMTFNLDFYIGSNGGCHGEHKLTTYNLKDGSVLILKDILTTDDLTKIRTALAQQFINTYNAKYLEETDTFELEKDVRLQNFSNEVRRALNGINSFDFGIYIEKTKVYTILNLPIFSCASGTLFPVQIPKELLKPAFTNSLHEDCQSFSPDCDG